MLTLKQVRAINKKFRAKDDSNLWPICGAFSVADRAIRRVARLQRQGLVIEDVYSYEAILEQEASAIVNNTANW